MAVDPVFDAPRCGVVEPRRPGQRTISPAATTDSTALPWTSSNVAGSGSRFCPPGRSSTRPPWCGRCGDTRAPTGNGCSTIATRAAGVLVPELNTHAARTQVVRPALTWAHDSKRGGVLMPLPAVASRNSAIRSPVSRIAVGAGTGVKGFLNRPDTFTPTGAQALVPSPEVDRSAGLW